MKWVIYLIIALMQWVPVIGMLLLAFYFNSIVGAFIAGIITTIWHDIFFDIWKELESRL